MTEILSDAIRTARKRYACQQCERNINPGQRYRRQVHTLDGLCTYRAHVDCDAVYSQMQKNAGSAWRGDDEFFPIRDIACAVDDKPWIIEQYPAVALRLWPEVVIVEVK